MRARATRESTRLQARLVIGPGSGAGAADRGCGLGLGVGFGCGAANARAQEPRLRAQAPKAPAISTAAQAPQAKSSARIRSTLRSAKAAVVSAGFAPMPTGMSELSITYSRW